MEIYTITYQNDKNYNSELIFIYSKKKRENLE